MKVRTVCGDISGEQLGITLPHEHLLIDLTSRVIEPPTDPYMRSIATRPVDCTIVLDLQRNPMMSSDSLCLADVEPWKNWPTSRRQEDGAWWNKPLPG